MDQKTRTWLLSSPNPPELTAVRALLEKAMNRAGSLPALATALGVHRSMVKHWQLGDTPIAQRHHGTIAGFAKISTKRLAALTAAANAAVLRQQAEKRQYWEAQLALPAKKRSTLFQADPQISPEQSLREVVSETARNAGVSQYQLAIAVGVTPANMHSGLSFDRVATLYVKYGALALGIDPDQNFNPVKNPPRRVRPATKPPMSSLTKMISKSKGNPFWTITFKRLVELRSSPAELARAARVSLSDMMMAARHQGRHASSKTPSSDMARRFEVALELPTGTLTRLVEIERAERQSARLGSLGANSPVWHAFRKACRADPTLSLTTLAARTGSDVHTVRKAMFEGVTHTRTAAKLAEALGASPTDLIADVAQKRESTTGHIIRGARVGMGLTLDALAKSIASKRGRIYNWEHGIWHPAPSVHSALETALNLEPGTIKAACDLDRSR